MGRRRPVDALHCAGSTADREALVFRVETANRGSGCFVPLRPF